MSTTATPRQSAAERRETIVEAAMAEFALGGLHGTSTEAVAKRAGISQPYLFRFFPTKKDLFVAAVERGFQRTLETFQLAVGRAESDDLFHEMGQAYVRLLQDRKMLLAQLHAYAACDEPEVRRVVRDGFGELHRYVQRVTGADEERIRDFFAVGMLINVMAAMDLGQVKEPWAKALLGACLDSMEAD
jgi:AcrR family transcriptional regulator